MTAALRFSVPLKAVLIEEGYDPVHYVTPPPEAAEQIAGHELARRLEFGKPPGFRSVKVTARIGGSEWATSAFRNKDGSWFLPIKKPVRLAEELAEGNQVEVELTLL